MAHAILIPCLPNDVNTRSSNYRVPGVITKNGPFGTNTAEIGISGMSITEADGPKATLPRAATSGAYASIYASGANIIKYNKPQISIPGLISTQN